MMAPVPPASTMDRYAVIGNPVAHSRSPDIHALFARETGESLAYERLLAPPGEFDRVALAFFTGGGRGANVTLPFKVDAWRLATDRDVYKRQGQDKDREFLTRGGVFSNDLIDAYIALKQEEVTRFRMTTHPLEYDMYYSA